MHFVAMGYDGTRPEVFAGFYNNLVTLLPCKTCAEHYAGELVREPVEGNLKDASDLFAWTVRVHNSVNRRLGKPQWSIQKARDHYLTLLQPPRSAASSVGVTDREELQRRGTLLWIFTMAIVVAVLASTLVVGGVYMTRRHAR